MERKIGYIKCVDISGLWGWLNLHWELRSDVNILSGINGSGKSSILRAIFQTLYHDVEWDEMTWVHVGHIHISFDDGESVHGVSVFADSMSDAVEKTKGVSGDYPASAIMRIDEKSFYVVYSSPAYLTESIDVKLINNFDCPLFNSESIQKLTEKRVTTELDIQLYQLQKSYLDYQINLANYVIQLLSSKNEDVDTRMKVTRETEKKSRFQDMIDELFQSTGKRIDRSKNDIRFILGEKSLSPYELSAGEKQLLAILLATLIQHEMPSIMLLDEPEISLHIEWQKNLINHIRRLNPNLQIILATHSPAIIMNGWVDAVSEVGDISLKPEK